MATDFTKARTWLLGAFGAAINSASAAATLVIVKPEDFNPFNGGLRDLLKVSFALAVTGFFLYLQQHPVKLVDLAGEEKESV